MKLKAWKRSGLTLVEVLFAFAILTTLLTLAYSSALNAWRTASSANQRTQAQYIAQQAIENLKAYMYSPCYKWTRGTDPAAPPGLIENMGSPQGASVTDTDGFLVRPAQVGEPGGYTVECPWVVEHIPPGVGSAQNIGSSDTDIDATIFTYRLAAVEYYIPTDANPIFPYDEAGARSASAIGIKVFVGWTSASGVPSNLEQSTILVRPADGAGLSTP